MENFLDVQNLFAIYKNQPVNSQISLKTALSDLEIPINNNLHKALTDAMYTAEVFRISTDKQVN